MNLNERYIYVTHSVTNDNIVLTKIIKLITNVLNVRAPNRLLEREQLSTAIHFAAIHHQKLIHHDKP